MNRASKSELPQILVKLLISINRKQDYESAEENINLAIQFKEKYPEYVVGIDLSGDPTAGDSFLKLLEISRKAGLRITAHCAEVNYSLDKINYPSIISNHRFVAILLKHV